VRPSAVISSLPASIRALMVFDDVSHYVDQLPRADGRLSKW
jgi:hypothetical protein